MKTRTTITLNQETDLKLKKYVLEMNRSKSSLINVAIDYFIKSIEEKDKKEIRLG